MQCIRRLDLTRTLELFTTFEHADVPSLQLFYNGSPGLDLLDTFKGSNLCEMGCTNQFLLSAFCAANF